MTNLVDSVCWVYWVDEARFLARAPTPFLDSRKLFVTRISVSAYFDKARDSKFKSVFEYREAVVDKHFAVVTLHLDVAVQQLTVVVCGWDVIDCRWAAIVYPVMVISYPLVVI